MESYRSSVLLLQLREKGASAHLSLNDIFKPFYLSMRIRVLPFVPRNLQIEPTGPLINRLKRFLRKINFRVGIRTLSLKIRLRAVL